MFLNGFIQRRLASLLRPWLRDEPDLELKLGFLRCAVTLKNINFNTFAINQLLDASSRLRFKEVSVRELSFRLSYWSFPAFTLRVHGLRFKISSGEEEAEEESGNARRRSKPRVTSLEDKRKVLAAIDPEGCAIHDAVEKILKVNIGNWRDKILCTVLRYSQLQMDEIHVLLLPPSSYDSMSCFLEINQLVAESECIQQTCFLGGLISSILAASQLCSFDLHIRGLEIGFPKESRISYVVSPTDLSVSIKMENLQFSDSVFDLPALHFSFSPEDISLILLFFSFACKELNYARSGRDLWRIAASRINLLVPTPKLSWDKVASSVKLWLYYLHTYENMLLITGYPVRDVVKESFTKMLSDKKYSRTVKHHWNVISECEQELSSEAIAQARRISRFRVSESTQLVKQASPGFKRSLWKVFHFFSLSWALTCRVLQQLFLGMFYLLHRMRNHPEAILQLKCVSDYSFPESCFYLSVGILSISLLPEKEVLASVHGFLDVDLIHFHISFDVFLLKYLQNFPDHHLTFSCGCIKVASSDMEDGNHQSNRRLREQQKKKILKPPVLLWCEPAQRVQMVNNHGHDSGVAFLPLLEFLVGQMWLDWENACAKFERNDSKISEAPCILFESKFYLIDQTVKSPTLGFREEVMALGRLNFVLGNSAILTLTVLSMQIQQALRVAGYIKGTNAVQDTSESHKYFPVLDLNSKCESVYSMIETTICKMIPEKRIQIGVMIAGPRFNLSLRKEKAVGEHEDLYPETKENMLELSFHLQDINLVFSPNSISDIVEPSEDLDSCDEQPSSLTVERPENIGIPKPANEIYFCQGCILLNAYLKFNGLKAYIGGLSAEPGDEILKLSAITCQSSFLRKDYRSLGLSIVATSAAVNWIASGFSTVVFLDELSTLVEVVSRLYSIVLQVSTFFGSRHHLSSQELLSEDCPAASSASGEVFANNGKWTSLVPIQSFFGLENKFELKSIDTVLYYSRKSHNGDNYRRQADILTSKKLLTDTDTVLDCGVSASIQRACGHFSFKDGSAELLIDLSVIRYVIFRYPIETTERSDKFSVKDLLLSMKCLVEASVSHCKFDLYIRNLVQSSIPEQQGNGADASFSCDSSRMDENFSMVMKNERSRNDLLHWLWANIYIGEIYLAETTLKNMFVEKDKAKFLNASFSAGEKFRTICCKSQGGSILLETEAVLMFVQYLNLYYCLLEDLLPSMPPEKHTVSPHLGTVVTHDNKAAQDIRQLMMNKWQGVESCSINLSQWTLTIVSRDEFGRFHELVFEANAQLDIEVSNILRRVSFEIPNFSILSQFFHETAEQQYKEIQVSHFSSTTCDELSPSNVVRDPPIILENGKEVHPLPHNSSFASTSVHRNEFYADKDSYTDDRGSIILHLSPQTYILKELCAVITVEWSPEWDDRDPWYLNQLWVGDGSITGFDMNVSLTQLQMILTDFESLSRVFSDGKTNDAVPKHLSMNQESEECLQEQVPDGIIVAIEDVCQHTYIAVEDAGSGYNLVGTIHYSLAGEKALFRVKHQNVGRWKSRVQYFYLISLYAKDASGEPLRLNGQSRSDFVDVSVSTDSAWALWSIIPYRPETYNGYSDWDPDCFSSKNTFYLVNKKNDQSVAFCDGVLEFVKKPGNVFKWKFFHDPLPPLCNSSPTSCLVGIPRTAIRHDSQVKDNRELRNSSKLRGITIVVQKATLTIVHELLDSTEKFPLLQGSISSTEVMLQMSNRKARFMTSLEITLHHFDSQRNLWRELVSPLEICIFFRYRFLIQGSENVFSKVPGHFFARIKELNVSLSELSLDVLLFVIGKLKLAGPFAVRNSVILANCCKVENQSGLTLLCRFFDGQHVIVGGRQTNTICLRHLALATRPLEASFFSVQLSDQGLSTALIHLSLLEATALTWRARIVSSQESKTFPGPFIVVEVSQKNEDGLSIIVSPLLRIHNETDLSMELRFQRPQEKETEFASLILKAGESIDDSMATFGGITLLGGIRKVFSSLSIGNFLFSFRPTITDDLLNVNVASVEWSHELRGGKPVPLSGIFEKLSYQVRAAFALESVKCAFGTANCSVRLEGGRMANIYFLIQTIGKDVPVIQPDNLGYLSVNKNSPIALQEQKEIYLLPTVHVRNLLEMDIHVNLTDADPQAKVNYDNLYSQANIPCGSDVNLYANPANIFFIVTLTAFDSSCKPVSSSQWAKKLQKQKKNANHLDIELEFGGGKYFAFLRLSRGQRGILEAAIFTSYTLRNDTENSLCCFGGNHKPLFRDEVMKLGSRFPPELGAYLPPNSKKSWFIKLPKVWVKLVEEQAFEALLNLDALSSLTEIDLETEEEGVKKVMKLGVSLKPSNETLPSLIVSLNPRHVVWNESEEVIYVRQCYLEDDMQRIITINSKQRTGLKLQNGTSRKRETTVFENLLRKHSKPLDGSTLFIQFRLNDANSCWSGPVCVASLGHFFLKFRVSLMDTERQSNRPVSDDPNYYKFAAVHVVEEDSTLVLHFHRPPNTDLPYRIENCLHNAPVTYYQKGSSQPETLGTQCSVDYVWDDLTLPHKLVVQLDDVHLLREINLDKVHVWKPFYRANQQRGMGLHFAMEMKFGDKRRDDYGQLISTGIMKLGYEVYAEGLTRVLRICEFSDRHKGGNMRYSSTKIQFGISNFALHFLEFAREDEDSTEALIYKPIIIIRLENIDMHSMLTNQYRVNCITVKSFSVDQKREGAPFAALLRRHQSHSNDTNNSMLKVVLALLSSSSTVTHIKYLSIILQPLDLNLDEETLMRIVPFWRISLSDPNAPSRQYYFDQFEIQPIKIVASFLPVDMFSSYTSTQEMLRSLLHSVIKIPTIKNKTMELNGVLITHALITLRELSIKCAQHYSWYALRAIYIAKGSPLLPPAFASMFDDFSSSSLDVFFDPSSGMVNLPGLTMGTFKFISKCIDAKGFSGTKRYFGDLGKTLKMAGSNILFAAVTEVSDSVLRGAETNGFNGMMRGFHQGILKLAMEPSLLGSALMEGGPDRKIKLDRAPGVDELYIEGYLQALLDALYKQEYLRVRVIDNQVILKNLPPNSSLINEIVERVKGFLISKGLLKGDTTTAHSFRHIRGESEWRIGPTVLTLFEHLLVSFAIRMLRKQAGKVMKRVSSKEKPESENQKAVVRESGGMEQKAKLVWRSGIGKFVLSGIVAYIDGRLCRSIPNPIARRVVSGFLLSFLDNDEKE